MADKRKQTLRTQLRPGLHNALMQDLNDALLLCEGEVQADYLREVVLSKYVGPDTAPAEERANAAIEKWLRTERRNERTNVRMYSQVADFGFATSDDVLEFAARVVKKVIGSDPPPTLLGSFSGGASTRYKRETGVAARKFTGQADVAEESWPYILPLILGSTGWLHNNPEAVMPRMVGGNVMFTVPKSTDIDRVACKEPDLNMFAQKACGDVIRQRLKRFGIDLNDQSINQGLAREGSRDGSLATIDLSSASDSVTTGLVGRLLPPGWFVLLDAIRCKRTLIGDEWHENHMFSSMGNGFTFELETLVFYALARAIAYFLGVRGRISVYGDDIIVPVKMAPALARCFSFYGFTVNSRKSFWKGRFRESCGGHYMEGADVSPFYVKEPIDHVERLIHFLNRLREWSAQNFGDVCDPRFSELWAKYARLVDKRLFGGWNTADPSRLVSRHAPRFQIVQHSWEPKRLITELQDGLYLQSLNALDRRGGAEPCDSVLRDPDEQLLSAVTWATMESLIAKSNTLKETSETRWVLRRASKVTWATPPYWYSPDGDIS